MGPPSRARAIDTIELRGWCVDAMAPGYRCILRRIGFGGRSERALAEVGAIVVGKIVVFVRLRRLRLRRPPPAFVAVDVAEIETGVDFGLTLACAFTRYVTRHLGPKVFTTEIDAHLRL